MGGRQIAEYLFLASVWGCSFLINLKVLHAFGWPGAVTFRALIAGAALLAAAAVMRRRLDFSAGWRPYAVVGATTITGQMVGLALAMPVIGTAMGAIFAATIPLFTMVISHFWGAERMRPQGLVGLLLGIAGIVLLVGFPAVPLTPSFALACLSCFVGSMSFAVGSVYSGQRLRAAGNWEVTIGSFLFGGLLTSPLMFIAPVPAPPAAIDYGYLLALGVVNTAIGFVVYFKLVTAVGATKAISVEFPACVIAVAIGAGLLREPLSLAQMLGAVVIVSGCALVLGLVPGTRPAAKAETVIPN